MPSRVVSVTRVIPAAPEAIFEVLADPARHPAIDGSGMLRQPRGNPARLSLGATFTMGMHHVVPYAMKNRVVEFDEPRRIAWHHVSRFVWRYDLKAVEGGTEVTESFDYAVPWGFVLDLLGWPPRNREAMARTLERLEALVTPGR